MESSESLCRFSSIWPVRMLSLSLSLLAILKRVILFRLLLCISRLSSLIKKAIFTSTASLFLLRAIFWLLRSSLWTIVLKIYAMRFTTLWRVRRWGLSLLTNRRWRSWRSISVFTRQRFCVLWSLILTV